MNSRAFATWADPDPDALFSIHALRRAWREVRRSGVSPGSDGMTLQKFEAASAAELNRLRQQLVSGTYQPAPVKRFYLKKANGKQRPIALWTVRDRIAQRLVHDYLTPLLEGMFLECSYGFRVGRSVEDAVRAILAARDGGLRWVVDADIADCFGSIRIDLLMGQVRRLVPSAPVVRLIDLWLHTPIVGDPKSIVGVSQGGVISPGLANLYLHRFDEMMLAALPSSRLIRFADDFVVLCADEDAASWALEVARRSLENLHLRLNLRKTRLIHFDDGFAFLGATFKGDEVKLPNPAKTKGEPLE